MVCVPCFIIPVLLFIWRLIVLPLIRRFWPSKQQQGNEPKFPFECAGGVCPIKPKTDAPPVEGSAATETVAGAAASEGEEKKEI